jgi:Ras-related protein Rab-11A
MAEEEIIMEELISSENIVENFKFKLIIVGDSGVGKTNLINRFAANQFNINSKSTIGVEFVYKTLKINNDIIKVEIWDTAGQERYKAITSAYYKGAKGAIIVYDITSEESFNNIEMWIQEVKAKALNNLQIMIIGNKSDLSKYRKVSLDKGVEKAKILDVHFFEASALDQTNVNEAFKCLIKEMYYDAKNKSRTNNNDSDGNNICENGIELKTENEKEKKCC